MATICFKPFLPIKPLGVSVKPFRRECLIAIQHIDSMMFRAAGQEAHDGLQIAPKYKVFSPWSVHTLLIT